MVARRARSDLLQTATATREQREGPVPIENHSHYCKWTFRLSLVRSTCPRRCLYSGTPV